MSVPQSNWYQSRPKIMKTRLLVVSLVLAMTGSASAEEEVLQECLDAAKNGALSGIPPPLK